MMDPIKNTKAMLAGMKPVLMPGEFVFCTTKDNALANEATPLALATFCETEGLSLVLEIETAKRLGFAFDAPMRRIVLEVYSSLEGVGLTAAVSRILSEQGIPCNMVSAFHHDHVFVPVAEAERALQLLLALQARSH